MNKLDYIGQPKDKVQGYCCLNYRHLLLSV